MSTICGCATAAILSLSLISVADAEQYNNGTASAYSTYSTVRPKAATVPDTDPTAADNPVYPWFGFGGPRQDRRDAWDGYFANPFDNPNFHGSNGG